MKGWYSKRVCSQWANKRSGSRFEYSAKSKAKCNLKTVSCCVDQPLQKLTFSFVPFFFA